MFKESDLCGPMNLTLKITQESLIEDFKKGVLYVPYNDGRFEPVLELDSFQDGVRHLMIDNSTSFADNYTAATEIEAGDAATKMMGLAGSKSLQHQSGCVVHERDCIRTEIDALIYDCADDKGHAESQLDNVDSEEAARAVIRNTVINLEVKSTISGSTDPSFSIGSVFFLNLFVS